MALRGALCAAALLAAVAYAARSYDVAGLPESFVLPDSAITPVKDQQSRGTCWIFSTIGVLESSYRKNGIEKGLLMPEEYVSFSEQAYGISFVKYCQTHPTDPYCFAGPAAGETADGEPEWLYYMNESTSKMVVPTAVCPYLPTDDKQMVCPDLDKALSANPVEFQVTELQSAYSVKSIKRLLYEKQVALSWSHAVYEATYVIPCSDTHSDLKDTEQCTKCLHPCKSSADGCCAEMVIPAYTQQGVFGMHRWPHQGGGHAMAVVGWNDEFRVDKGLPGQMNQFTQGGFIIKNSWGTALGHSAAYWAQKHSLTDENFICPVESSSVTWIGADEQCMLRSKDPLACSNGAVKIVRKSWVHGATVLKCSPKAISNPDRAKLMGWTGCVAGWNYVLVTEGGEVKVTVPAESDGYVRFHLVGWNPSNPSAPAVSITTEDSTWYGIEWLLNPVSVIGNSEQCGFFFVPYETFEEGLVRYPVEGHDTVSVSYMNIEWPDSAYFRSPVSGKDYSLLKQSTFTMKQSKFQGPFDWKAEV